jgi:hypothetical protein
MRDGGSARWGKGAHALGMAPIRVSGTEVKEGGMLKIYYMHNHGPRTGQK